MKLSPPPDLQESSSSVARKRRMSARKAAAASNRYHSSSSDEDNGEEYCNDNDEDDYSEDDRRKRSRQDPPADNDDSSDESFLRGVKQQSRYFPKTCDSKNMTKKELSAWRKEARRLRNRESAAASRQKTRNRILELEGQVETLNDKYRQALERIQELVQHRGGNDQGGSVSLSLGEDGIPILPPPAILSSNSRSSSVVVSPPESPRLSPQIEEASLQQHMAIISQSIAFDSWISNGYSEPSNPLLLLDDADAPASADNNNDILTL